MAITLKKWLNKTLPQNLILRKPLAGTIILSLIWFVFITLYQPLGVRAAKLNLVLTMAAYCFIQGFFIYLAARLLKHIPYFSKESEWTILKEALSIIIMLFTVGVVIYFAGFLIEPPAQRWNMSTFLDSCEKAALIGLIPFSFFTIMNYRYLFYSEKEQHYDLHIHNGGKAQDEELIHIISQLKKEELNFYPVEFLYCEADGNYVIFHLFIKGNETRKMIRNSINNIEQQFARIPYIMRIHRAFIVNLNMVSSRKGNTLGYQLKIYNTDAEIPVSRNNTRNFDMRMKNLR